MGIIRFGCPSVNLFQIGFREGVSSVSLQVLQNPLASQFPYFNQLPLCGHPLRTDYRNALRGCFKSIASQTYFSPDNSSNRKIKPATKVASVAGFCISNEDYLILKRTKNIHHESLLP